MGGRFRQRGELPNDGLMREAVLVIAELVDLLELYVAGARDVVLRMYGTVPPDEVMAETVRDLRDCVVLEDCGHWTQQERPDAVNRALLELFDSV